MKFRNKTAKFAALAVLMAAIAGCGNSQLKTHPVHGQFKYEDGTFPKFGEVEFYNAQHRLNARGKINRDGTFTVGTFKEADGAVAGKHRVVVMQHVTSPLTARALTDRNVQHDHGKLLSPHYYDYRTSDLECEVLEQGDNRFEWTLKLNPQQTADGMPKK
jgi:hypothetical protein